MDDFRLYLRLVAGRVRSQLQYRTSFVLGVIGAGLLAVLDLLVVLVLFSNVPAIGGWSTTDVCLLYGVAQCSFAIADAIFGHLDDLPAAIRTGQFDGVLLRPRSSLLLSVASDFTIRKLGQLLQAAVVLVVVWTTTKSLSIDVVDIVVLAISMAAGVVIFGAVWVAGAATTFWTIETMEITNSFTYGGRQATSYPMTIYGPWLRRLLTFVVPLAGVAYYPVRYVLGLEPPGTALWVRFAGVPIAAVATIVAGTVWQAAVRSYRGTGS